MCAYLGQSMPFEPSQSSRIEPESGACQARTFRNLGGLAALSRLHSQATFLTTTA